MTASSEKDRVLIFDTTLRDGEQSPGATMTHTEKLEIAGLLDEMGVDIIEAGFPIASEGDFKAVSEIARNAQNAVICGLARASFTDIDRCWDAVRHARRPRIHTFIGTSPLHRAIPNLTMDEMADRIHETVSHARNLCDNVQWSPMDATRTEWDYLCRVVECAGVLIGHGIVSTGAGEAHILNLCVRPEYRCRGIGRQLLRYLLDHANEVHDAEALFSAVWIEDEVDTLGLRPDQRDRLRRLVFQLRQHVEPNPSVPRYVCTAHGVGYVLYADEEGGAS